MSEKTGFGGPDKRGLFMSLVSYMCTEVSSAQVCLRLGFLFCLSFVGLL